MLDALPPPALYEEAPDWARTQSGLLIPTKKSILPGMTPYPGLIGGSGGSGNVQVPPWPTTPTTFIASLNGTATSGVASTTGTPSFTSYSAVLVWVTTRTIAPDANPQSHVVTDTVGGTYTRVGAETRYTNGPAGGNSYVSQLWKRDQLVSAPGQVFGVSVTTTTAASGLWNCALIYEVKNPGNYPFQCEARSVQSTSSGSSFTMPNEGDLFCMDFCSGGGATSTISVGSGFTKLYEAATYVSSNLRFTILASGLQAQKAGRTYSFTTFESVTSAAMWFDGPKRSKPAIQMQYLGNYAGTTFGTSFSFPACNIGTPAADRMVHVLVMGAWSTTTTMNFSSTPNPSILPWQNFIPILAARSPCYIYSALVPTGTTMDFAVTSTNTFCSIYIWVSYGQARLGPNQNGLVLGDATTPRVARVDSGGTPLTTTGVVVPKGTLLIGGAHAYSGAIGAAGNWTVDGTNPPATGGAGFGARIDNLVGLTDLTGQTLTATFAGTNAVGLCGEVFGP